MKEVADALEEYLEEPEGGPVEAAKPRRAKWSPHRRVGIAAVAVVLALLGGVLVWQTSYGTLQIEIHDPDLQVALDGDKVVVQSESKEVRLNRGEHRFAVKLGDQLISMGQTATLTHGRHNGQYKLAVRLDGAELTSDRFTIHWGGKRALTVRLEPVGTEPGTAPAPQEPGRFVFSAFDGKQWDLYTYVPSTNELSNITRTEHGQEHYPRFSPDGRWIAFQSNRDGYGGDDPRYDVYVTDGSEFRRLTSQIGWKGGGVAWSPGGKELLASVEQWEDGDPFPPWTNRLEVWRIPLDGTAPERIPGLSEAGVFYRLPDWRADGNVVLARHDRPLVYSDIFVTRLDGAGPAVRMTDTHYSNAAPRWSPDGKQIWFASERDSPGIFRIYVMNADGSGSRACFYQRAVDMDPVPVDDGTRVAFIRSPQTGPQLMIARADSATAKKLLDLDDFEQVESLDWTAGAAVENASGDGAAR
jgi:hypothetical protein